MNRCEAIRELQGWRSTAIFDGDKAQSMRQTNPALDEALSLAIDALKERKTGKWVAAQKDGCVTYSNAYRQCTSCNERVFLGNTMRYCPNCGAKMEVDE